LNYFLPAPSESHQDISRNQNMLLALNRQSIPAVVALVSSLLAPGVQSQEVRTDIVASGLQNPWALAFLPDGRFLVTERAGRLRLLAASVASSENCRHALL